MQLDQLIPNSEIESLRNSAVAGLLDSFLGVLGHDPDPVRQKARTSLVDFFEYESRGRHIAEPWQHLLCSKLEQLADPEHDLKRLMVFVPPRHGKSTLCSKKFPAWYLSKYPDNYVMICSYASDLSYDFSRDARNTLETERELFPHIHIAQDSRAVKHWSLSDHVGGLIAAGVGGPITGRGCNCFPAGIMVETESGSVDISYLAQMKNPPRVLSYDHKYGKMVYKKIIATRKTWANEFTEIQTSSGRKVQSTPEHRFYVSESGYRQAHSLERGNRLVATEIAEQQDLRFLWDTKDRKGFHLPTMLPQVASGRCDSQVRLLPKRVQKDSVRLREGHQEGPQRRLLFFRLFNGTSCDQEQAKVSRLWGNNEHQDKQILFRLQGSKEEENTKTQNLPHVFRNFSAQILPHTILLPRLRRQSSFHANEGKGQRALQNWHKLCQVARRNATDYFGTGQISLCGLQRQGEFPWHQVARSTGPTVHAFGASHRRESVEQCSRESGSSLRLLSPESPPCYQDTITKTRRIRTPSIPVYDLQVEKTSNFFANGLLAHNCGIIDDPFKNYEEAQSDTTRESVWQWYLSTFRTRLFPKAGIVLVMTRWHQDDLAGRLLKAQAEGTGEEWEVISYPAIAGSDDPLGRTPGEALSPRYPLTELNPIKETLTPYLWNSLYQQRPRPEEGNYYKVHWMNDAGVPNKLLEAYRNKGHFIPIYAAMDYAIGERDESNWNVITVGAPLPGDELLLLDRVKFKGEEDADTIASEMVAVQKKWAPLLWGCEDGMIRKAIWSTVKRKFKKEGLLLNAEFLVPIKDKLARGRTAQGQMRQGQWLFPKDAEWYEDFSEELLGFPNAEFDDQADSFAWLARLIADVDKTYDPFDLSKCLV